MHPQSPAPHPARSSAHPCGPGRRGHDPPVGDGSALEHLPQALLEESLPAASDNERLPQPVPPFEEPEDPRKECQHRRCTFHVLLPERAGVRSPAPRDDPAPARGGGVCTQEPRQLSSLARPLLSQTQASPRASKLSLGLQGESNATRQRAVTCVAGARKCGRGPDRFRLMTIPIRQ